MKLKCHSCDYEYEILGAVGLSYDCPKCDQPNLVTAAENYWRGCHHLPMDLEDKSKAGLKFDDGKPPIVSMLMNYFPLALTAVALASEYGGRKYEEGGWRTVPDGIARYSDGLGRHLLKEQTEGPYDLEDSGLPHAAQTAWNALARLEKMIEEGKVNIVRGNDIDEDGKPILGTARVIK